MKQSLYQDVSDKLEELMGVIYRATPRQRLALQEKLRSLTDTDCWWAMHQLRTFLSSYCDDLRKYKRQNHSKGKQAKKEKP
jgi:hypothetical protein